MLYVVRQHIDDRDNNSKLGNICTSSICSQLNMNLSHHQLKKGTKRTPCERLQQTYTPRPWGRQKHVCVTSAHGYKYQGSSHTVTSLCCIYLGCFPHKYMNTQLKLQRYQCCDWLLNTSKLILKDTLFVLHLQPTNHNGAYGPLSKIFY